MRGAQWGIADSHGPETAVSAEHRARRRAAHERAGAAHEQGAVHHETAASFFDSHDLPDLAAHERRLADEELAKAHNAYDMAAAQGPGDDGDGTDAPTEGVSGDAVDQSSLDR